VASSPLPAAVEAQSGRASELAPKAVRVNWLDQLRLLAAFQMLQGHTIGALLAPEYRVGPWHALWSSARGLTSVAFLFAAGLSFQLALQRGAGGRAGRWQRALGLIALGYLMHLPLVPALRGELSGAVLRSALQVDVLQCIGVCLLALRGLARIAPEPRRLAAICAGFAVAALAPLAAAQALPLPLWLDAYFSARAGSLFPLLPWSAHLFAGAACGAFVQRSAAAPRLAALALGLVASGFWARSAHAALIADHLSRLGLVVGVCALLAALAVRAGSPRGSSAGPGRLLAALRTGEESGSGVRGIAAVLSRETLVLYVFHVVWVYGDGLGLAAQIGPTLSPAAALGAALAVVAVSAGAALVYRRARDSWSRPLR
jgi:uncharacterized membrane protein